MTDHKSFRANNSRLPHEIRTCTFRSMVRMKYHHTIVRWRWYTGLSKSDVPFIYLHFLYYFMFMLQMDVPEHSNSVETDINIQ